MADTVLSDKNVYPSEGIIFSHIGKSAKLWIEFFNYLHAEHPDFTEEWHYYNDGKSWLMKVRRKTKTVFWLSLADKTFRTTFYFPSKAEQAVLGSTVADELKDTFRNRNKDSKIHGITVWFHNKQDLEQAKILCDLKLSLK
ncbi:MAG TPA: DUF3788 family protein [Spirochaetota bacterium]|nr:DUF3788 family protein [Spirochaetota bacterium]